MDTPIKIEIITYAPTAFFHCTHCEVAFHEMDMTRPIHQEQLQASLPSDLSIEFQGISDWITNIGNHYPNSVTMRITDAASVEGLLKSLRFGIFHYPAIIVDGKCYGSGLSYSLALREIEQNLTKGGQYP